MLTRSQTLLGACLLLFCFSLYGSTDAQKQTANMNDLCRLVANGVKLADPNNCTYYYSCQNGTAVHEWCLYGQTFDKNQQSCNYQSNCNNYGNDPCSGHAYGSLLPVPGSCTKYYYCSYMGGIPSECTPGWSFDALQQTCKYMYPCVVAPEGETQRDTNLCRYIPDGIFFGSPSECADWNICYNNNMSSGSCPRGLVYNVPASMCDYPKYTDCSQVNPDLVLQDPNIDGPCQNKHDTKPATTCNRFYECDGHSYKLNVCPHHLYYDVVSGKCVERLNARNPCDRCQGTDEEFVNKYSPYSCNGFLYCINGIMQTEGKCKQGSYFNERLGSCVYGDQPMFGCCNPEFWIGTTTFPTTHTTPTTTVDVTPSTTEYTTTDVSTNAPTETTAAVTDETTQGASETTEAVSQTTPGVPETTEAVTDEAKTTEGEPETTEAASETTQAVPSTTEAVTDETTEGEPETTEAVSETTQAVPSTTEAVTDEATEGEPETTEAVSETTQAVPSTTEAVTDEATEGEPETTEAVSETTQAVPSTTEAVTDEATEGEPETTEAVSEETQAVPSTTEAVTDETTEGEPETTEAVSETTQAIPSTTEAVTDEATEGEPETTEAVSETTQAVPSTTEAVTDEATEGEPETTEAVSEETTRVPLTTEPVTDEATQGEPETTESVTETTQGVSETTEAVTDKSTTAAAEDTTVAPDETTDAPADDTTV